LSGTRLAQHANCVDLVDRTPKYGHEVYFTAAGTVPRVEAGHCLDISNPVP
jgi:hypothetical protein